MTVTIIAEAGVNHNGSPEMAVELVECAARAGADMVKFQTFKADRLAAANAPKADYQRRTTDGAESQYAMLRRLELSESVHVDLINQCRQRHIGFLSTPFDLGSLRFLVADLGLKTIKIPSGEILNAPMLLAAARRGVKIILSTGMSDLTEISEALGVMAYGYLGGKAPSRAAFAAAWESAEGKAVLRDNVVLLHCTTEYPAPFESVNLRAMKTMADHFGLPVGLSDHTTGINVAVAAVALGATVIEKHFTLDRSLPGPDHAASLIPEELTALVQGIRQVEIALGSPEKQAQPCELGNRSIARKSLIAARAIKTGERFTPDNLAVKRPGTGRSPMDYFDLLGQPADQDYEADEVLA